MSTDDCHCSRRGLFSRPGALFLFALLAVSALCLPAAPALAGIDGGGSCVPGVDVCTPDSNPCTVEFCSFETHRCESRPKTCFADDNLCVTLSCNPENGQCEGTPKTCAQDDNLCTTEACNPATGTCGSTPVTCTADDNLCTTEACNPTTGSCSSTAVTCTADDNLCTFEACNPATGGCASTPVTCTADDNLCTTETCNPATGACGSRPVTCTADDNLCTSEACNPSTGACASTPVTCTADDNLCTTEACNSATGACGSTAVTCTADDNLCTTEACNPATGACGSTAVTCTPDDNLCTTESCVPGTGACESSEPRTCEADNDECTTESCDPHSGRCVSEPANPTAVGCGAAICRTPGFWGTHAGVETTNQVKGKNITQAVIDAAGGSLSVCGETITSTIVSDDASALEGICVSPSGNIRLQLARQLTAAALNCVVSGGQADCSGTQLYASIFAECNLLCTQSGASTTSITSCVDQIDCLNNGGNVLSNGFCQTGTCLDGQACGDKGACLDGSACTPLERSCHELNLVNVNLGLNFEPPGPAGSSKGCNDAKKSNCVVIGSGQTSCLY